MVVYLMPAASQCVSRLHCGSVFVVLVRHISKTYLRLVKRDFSQRRKGQILYWQSLTCNLEDFSLGGCGMMGL